MIRWYGWKKGLHISRKSRFLIVGMTMSSSSFSRGVAEVDDIDVVGTKTKQGRREKVIEREQE